MEQNAAKLHIWRKSARGAREGRVERRGRGRAEGWRGEAKVELEFSSAQQKHAGVAAPAPPHAAEFVEVDRSHDLFRDTMALPELLEHVRKLGLADRAVTVNVAVREVLSEGADLVWDSGMVGWVRGDY